MCYESYHLLKNSCRPIFISICRPSFISICWPTFLNSCLALGHMFLLCVCVCVRACVCVCDHMFHRLAPPLPITGKELVGAIEVVQTSECSIILGLNVYIHYFSIYKCEMFRCAASLVGSVPLGVNCT